jgi:DNA-binding beta-propeller fold protein YncE
VVAEKTGTFYGQTMTAGDIYTVAGNGTTGFSGDGGPAAKAEFSDPTGVAVDSTGNLAIADQGNNRIRMIAEKTGTFYGQAMTANHIYTVAGTCTTGFSGDGGPAIQADLSFPVGLTVNGPGLLIADAINNRIRQITR